MGQFREIRLKTAGTAAWIISLSVFICAFQVSKKRFIKIFLADGFVVTAELAVTNEEQQQGLMFREKINPDQGMLFPFDEPGIHSMWMKNMRFSIDILWLDNDKRIVHMEQKLPPCPAEPCPSYDSEIPARYVLELEGGSVERHRIKLNDRLDFVLPKNLFKDRNL